MLSKRLLLVHDKMLFLDFINSFYFNVHLYIISQIINAYNVREIVLSGAVLITAFTFVEFDVYYQCATP